MAGNDDRLVISAAAGIAVAIIYYLLDFSALSAFIIPVAVHECGHAAAIVLSGKKLCSLRAEVSGLCIAYEGEAGRGVQLLIAVAGPVAGLVYAVAASYAGNCLNYDWLRLSSGISLLFSFFNTLPILPLDGGRIAVVLFGEAAYTVSYIGAIVLLIIGTYLSVRGAGNAVLAAGIWLLICQNEKQGIVKRNQIR